VSGPEVKITQNISKYLEISRNNERREWDEKDSWDLWDRWDEHGRRINRAVAAVAVMFADSTMLT
jgi:hypothetical protein